MIKNIVFDMGNVLVKYSAEPTCEHFIEDTADRERVRTAVFTSPEWILMDMGVITDEQALRQICTRLPERLHEAAALCLRDWHLYNMNPIGEMEQVLRDLKARDFGVYVLSNAAIRLKEIWPGLFPAPECYDGVLFSAEVKCIKPQKEIYEHFFTRFRLKPEECFFIDDLPSNIEGARACGMDGYCFGDGDVERLRKVLERFYR
ncbi:MAG: HAD family phosphatase [Lachnospiraceae bacterium]|nr:HAD family phosphatase [Lachnospiraceae bacterium]